MSDLVVYLVGGSLIGGIAAACRMLHRELREAREATRRILRAHTELFNQHHGRLAQLEDSEKLCRSGLLFVAEKMDEAEHHRNPLDPERLAPSEN